MKSIYGQAQPDRPAIWRSQIEAQTERDPINKGEKLFLTAIVREKMLSDGLTMLTVNEPAERAGRITDC